MFRDRRTLAISTLLLAAGAAVFAVFYARLWSYLTDDVFISVRYAANFAAGRGLVYNAGERVEGYTNFLWTLLVTPAFPLNANVITWVKVMNAAWAALAALLAVRVTAAFAAAPAGPEAAAPQPPAWWVALPAALLLASSPFVLSAAEGLETMMFTALLLLAILWVWDAREDERLPRAGLAIAALGLTRPDGWAYLPWAVVAAKLRGRSWAWTLRLGAVALAVLAAHEAFRFFAYGDLLPNTLHAKRGGSGFLFDRGWTQMLDFLGATGGWLWLLALLPLAWRESRPGALALLLALAVRVAFHLWSGGPWMARGRFLTPVLPLVLVLFTWGTALALKRGWKLAAGLAVLAALVLAPGWRRHANVEAASLQYGQSLRRAHMRLGADIAAHTDPAAVMAMDDAGLGPLMASRTSIDMLGLNDRHLGHLPGNFGEKFDAQYLLDRNPDLIVLVGRHAPPITARDLVVTAEIQLFEDPLFQERYRFAKAYEFTADYWLLLYVRNGSTRVRPALAGPPPQ